MTALPGLPRSARPRVLFATGTGTGARMYRAEVRTLLALWLAPPLLRYAAGARLAIDSEVHPYR
jgi:hypothetical protein